jgi:hypothetical protein
MSQLSVPSHKDTALAYISALANFFDATEAQQEPLLAAFAEQEEAGDTEAAAEIKRAIRKGTKDKLTKWCDKNGIHLMGELNIIVQKSALEKKERERYAWAVGLYGRVREGTGN